MLQQEAKMASDDCMGKANNLVRTGTATSAFGQRRVVPCIEGIIVAYDMLSGVILLKRGRNESLTGLASRYAASEYDKGFWFASFTWAAIDEKDRERIEKLHASPDGARAIKGRRRPTKRRGHLRELLLGRPVVCRIQQSPKWKAVHIQVLLNKPMLTLPERRIETPKNSGHCLPCPWNSTPLALCC